MRLHGVAGAIGGVAMGMEVGAGATSSISATSGAPGSASAMPLERLIVLQRSVADTLGVAYRAFEGGSPVAVLVRLNAVACRTQLNDSVHICRNLGSTSRSVMTMLPDLTLAIAHGETEYAGQCFKTISGWVSALKVDARKMHQRNRDVMMQVNRTIEAMRAGVGGTIDNAIRSIEDGGRNGEKKKTIEVERVDSDDMDTTGEKDSTSSGSGSDGNSNEKSVSVTEHLARMQLDGGGYHKSAASMAAVQAAAASAVNAATASKAAAAESEHKGDTVTALRTIDGKAAEHVMSQLSLAMGNAGREVGNGSNSKSGSASGIKSPEQLSKDVLDLVFPVLPAPERERKVHEDEVAHREKDKSCFALTCANANKRDGELSPRSMVKKLHALRQALQRLNQVSQVKLSHVGFVDLPRIYTCTAHLLVHVHGGLSK